MPLVLENNSNRGPNGFITFFSMVAVFTVLLSESAARVTVLHGVRARYHEEVKI